MGISSGDSFYAQLVKPSLVPLSKNSTVSPAHPNPQTPQRHIYTDISHENPMLSVTEPVQLLGSWFVCFHICKGVKAKEVKG